MGKLDLTSYVRGHIVRVIEKIDSYERRCATVELVLMIGAFILLTALAGVFGVDTRDSDDWVIHRPV
jgi:hypothetical protein